jgi:small-conductance mechanosensitive channel
MGWAVGLGLTLGLAAAGLAPGARSAWAQEAEPEPVVEDAGDRGLASIGLTTDLYDPKAVRDRMGEIQAEADAIPATDPWRSAWLKVIEDEREVLGARLDYLRVAGARGREAPDEAAFQAVRLRIAEIESGASADRLAARSAAVIARVSTEAFGEVLVRDVFAPVAAARGRELRLAAELARLDGERLSLPAHVVENDALLRDTVQRLHDLQALSRERRDLGTVEASLADRRQEASGLFAYHLRDKGIFLELRTSVLLAWTDLAQLQHDAARLELEQAEWLRDQVLDAAKAALAVRLETARASEAAASAAASTAADQTLLQERATNARLERYMVEWRLYAIAAWRSAAQATDELDRLNRTREALARRFAAVAGGDEFDGPLVPKRVASILSRPLPELPPSPQAPDGASRSPSRAFDKAKNTLDDLERTIAAARAGSADDAAWDSLGARRRATLEILTTDLRHVVWLRSAIRGSVERLRETRTGVRTMVRRQAVVGRTGGRVTWEAAVQGVRDLAQAPRALARTRREVRDYVAERQAGEGAIAAGIVGLVALLLLLGVRWRLGVEREDEPGRTAGPPPRIVLSRALCLALALAAPFLAASWMLPALSPFAQTFFLALALSVGGYVAGRAINAYVATGGPAQENDAAAVASVRRGFGRMLLLTCTLAPFAFLLHRSAYDAEGVTRLLWWLYAIAMIFVLVRDVLAKDALARTLVPEGGRGRKVVVATLGGARVVLLTAAPVLLLLELLGYGVLAELLASFGLLVVAAFSLGMAVLRRPRSKETEATPEDDGPKQTLARTIVRFSALLIISGLTGWVALSVHDVPFTDVMGLLQTPLPFQSSGAENPLTYLNLLKAVVIALLFLSLARGMRGTLDNALKKASGLDRGLRYTIVEVMRYVTLAVGAYLSLRQLFDLSAFGYLVAALGVGIGFGLQEIVGNFVSGLILLFERPIKVGDLVEVGTEMGIVEHISIRATTVQTFDNVSLLIPNREFVSQRVTNYTHEDLKFRDRVTVGVAYGTDLGRVKQVLLEVAQRDTNLLPDPPPDVLFLGFGASSLDFALVYWGYSQRRAAIRSALYFAVDAAFREHGIAIPFPQRDVHMIAPKPADAEADEHGSSPDEDGAE